MKKIKAFLLLNWETKRLFIEALFFLGWARILKSVPFNKVAPSLGEHLSETSFSSVNGNVAILKSVSKSINIMSRNTLWESQCLVKAIAAMKMLERRNIESTLYLGTGKDDDGKFAAHAWLRSGPYYITGADVMERFIVVGIFGKNSSDGKNENTKAT
ncbi:MULTISPECIES: lasso peptide biosynthesis B2 protein [Bacillaceae]|uniref:lasso peptide biosynthesis B2 protein n=1 Tax=Bacillaceae TaxID=186817 RepID=UPI0006604F86|nr:MULTISPECIES: lasso peptide biosynthesis B2 protein [Bacillaceae]MCF7623638.1 lasso peptide biosynthesis B2 protein [Peribacillus frigoritolerans]PRA94477.1 stage V sporulation protein S [Peribacillus simplex]